MADSSASSPPAQIDGATQSNQINYASPDSKPRRLLIVSPHFAPVSAVDYQRIRLLLPHLASQNWTAEILTVHPQYIEHGQDKHLLAPLPASLKIHRVRALPQRWTRRIGLGNLGWRALPFLAVAGDRLLRQQRFDLIFFSTTVFPCLLLGPRWRQKFGIPYILDFQDPWRVEQQQQQQRAQQRPGGALKYAVDKTLARWFEPQVVRQAAQIIAVSPDYLTQLQTRYPSLCPSQCHLITFGAPAQDFQQLSHLSIQQQIFDPDDGDRHWVYVGRGGDDLRPAVEQLFRAIASARQRSPRCWRRLKLHFVGTSYAPGAQAQPSFLDLANQYGLTDIVEEIPQRVPYFESLQLLAQSHAILLLGSKDPSYSPSKLYPCLLAQKPLLALAVSMSPVGELIRTAQPEALVASAKISPAFRSQSNTVQDEVEVEQRIQQRLSELLSGAACDRKKTQQVLHPYLPEQLNQQLIAVFERALSEPHP